MASKKKNNTGLVIAMLFVSVVGGALVGAYVMTTPDAQHIPVGLRRPSDVVSAKSLPQSTGDRITARIGKDGLVGFDASQVVIPKGADARVFLVNEFLKDLHTKGLGNKDARAVGVDLHNGLATIDFSPEFGDTTGTMDEATILNGILTTLGQFSDIDKVQFRVNGKPMDSLGNIDLSTPQNVLRPGQNTPTTPTAP
jgi:hypothetical protein